MKNVETAIDGTNDLRFSTSKVVGKEHIFVNIRLNDECKNGHQDFSITGDIYQAGKPKIDKYFISGGCIHEAILKHFPKFAPFVHLHLSDWEGVPMHAVANGFYHLQKGFNVEKVGDINFPPAYCEYYRITLDQFNALNECPTQLQFALKLQSLGILKQWKEQANEAIKQLEALTGKRFVSDSVRSQYEAPTTEAIQEEEQKIASGYYTPEAQEQRRKEAIEAKIAKMRAEADKDIAEIEAEFDIEKQILLVGGEEARQNFIYYKHTKEIAFNWRESDKISDELINKIKNHFFLPEGVTFKN